MFYREAGQFKTSYEADSQIFPIRQDRLTVGALLAVALATLPGQSASAPFWWWVGALFVYIATLSLIARREYEIAPAAAHGAAENRVATSRRAARLGQWVGRLLAFIPLIDAVALLLVGAWIPAIACAAAIPLGRWAQRVAAST